MLLLLLPLPSPFCLLNHQRLEKNSLGVGAQQVKCYAGYFHGNEARYIKPSEQRMLNVEWKENQMMRKERKTWR